MQISVLEMQIYEFNLEIKISVFQIQVSAFASGKHAYIILTHLNPSFICKTGVYQGIHYFCLKPLIVRIREAVVTSANNLCFEQK